MSGSDVDCTIMKQKISVLPIGIKSVFESINSIRHNDSQEGYFILIRDEAQKRTGTTETSVQVETTPREHYEYGRMILCNYTETVTFISVFCS